MPVEVNCAEISQAMLLAYPMRIDTAPGEIVPVVLFYGEDPLPLDVEVTVTAKDDAEFQYMRYEEKAGVLLLRAQSGSPGRHLLDISAKGHITTIEVNLK